MKVLLTQVIAGIGGSEMYLAGIIPALIERGIDCTFLNIYHPKNRETAQGFSELLRKNGIPVIEFEMSSYFNVTAYFKLNKLYKEGQYDLVHTHLIHTDFTWAVTKFLVHRKICLISTKHGYLQSYVEKYGFDPHHGGKDMYWWVAWLSEKMVNRSFAVSKVLQHLMVEKGLCRADKIEVIYHGIKPPKEIKYEPAFRHGNPQLVVVGRLIAFKGHTYALQAMPKLIAKYPDIQLVIVGIGNEKEKLVQQTKQLQIENYIKFVGFSNRPLDYMHTSDIVLVPSIGEAFGLVTLEAMSAQRPVVAFDVAAPNEIIENGKTGVLVAAFEVEDWVEQLSELIENPQRRSGLAAAAIQRTLEKFSFEGMVEETIGFYEQVVEVKNKTL